MEFLNKQYKFKESKTQTCLKLKIKKIEDDTYACTIDFENSILSKKITFLVPVTISSSMYVESVAVNVDVEQKKMELKHEWKINNRIVEQFKVKCKFKGTRISPVSSILVLHKNMKKWISYPFSILGELVYD